MKFKTLALLGLLIILAAQSLPTFGSTPGGANLQDIELTAVDFAGGTGSGFAITNDGLTLADDAMTAVYTSPIIDTPIAFNTAVPKWQADVPDFASMELQVRTRTNGGAWSQWYDIHENDDWTPEGATYLVGEMIVVPPEDTIHQQFQFSISFSRYAGTGTPVLRQFTLTIMDTSAGPTTADLLDQQAALDAARQDSIQAINGYPRPSVISRDVWCTSVDCDYTAGLNYKPASHIVVHHTVSSNEHTDWAPIVRAIWNYHTYGNDWGDIGYNYLIDRNGVIYEGHMNADFLNLDVIGTHAADANSGSMGVSLMGTFTSAEENYPNPTDPIIEVPPPAMQNALTDLMAWKVDQRNIDIYGASRMPDPDIKWGLPHIMGHRDVYGGTSTTCPGGSAYALIPTWRDQVAQRLGYTPPHIEIDELSSAFTKSNNNWHEALRGCGFNTHAFYTWNVTSANLVENWGEWRPNVPQTDVYEILVYAPYCDTDAPETDGAIYTITHANGTSPVTVSHADNIGLWMSLGSFKLNAGTGNLIRLTDLTANDATNYDYGVWFDAIRLVPNATLPTVDVHNSLPSNTTWMNQTAVAFNWSVDNASLVSEFTLQVATDAAFSNIIHQQTVPGTQTSITHDFAQDYAVLYWRVAAKTVQLTTVTSAATTFGIDSVKPTSIIGGVYKLTTGIFVLSWQGSDSTSGIIHYSAQYRASGTTNWIDLVNNTNATSVAFTPPNSPQTYEFRVQAADIAGNIENLHVNPDIDTTQAILLSHTIMMPIVAR